MIWQLTPSVLAIDSNFEWWPLDLHHFNFLYTLHTRKQCTFNTKISSTNTSTYNTYNCTENTDSFAYKEKTKIATYICTYNIHTRRESERKSTSAKARCTPTTTTTSRVAGDVLAHLHHTFLTDNWIQLPISKSQTNGPPKIEFCCQTRRPWDT